jgi:ABC-type antimicrobial peptide transport system permease subunit
VAARSESDPAALAAPIRDRIGRLDPDVPVSRISTMRERLSTSMAQPRLQTAVLAGFALLALLLAGVGTYGVTSYGARQRTREIGIRMAAGAGRRDILALILGRTARTLAAGLAAGALAAVLVTRALRSLLFEVSSTDPWVYAGVAAVLGAIALFAAFLPARRATRLDPVAALRED